MSHYNLFLKRDPSRVNTPVKRPRRTVFGPTAGLTPTHPLYKGADAMPLKPMGEIDRAAVQADRAAVQADRAAVQADAARYRIRGFSRTIKVPTEQRMGLEHGGKVLVGDVWKGRPDANRTMTVVAVEDGFADMTFSDGSGMTTRGVEYMLSRNILVSRSLVSRKP